MFFKNAMIFMLPQEFVWMPSAFTMSISECKIHDIGPLEMEAHGFSPVLSDGEMMHSSSGRHLMCYVKDARMLPTSVVDSACAEKIREYEQANDRPPGKRMRKEIRDTVIGELLPRAFVKRSKTLMHFDEQLNALAIDTSSQKTAEDAVSTLRTALGSFPCRPVASEASVGLVLSEWLISGDLPVGLELGGDVEMKDPSDLSSVVRGRNHDLGAEEIREHARCGKMVTQLGLIYGSRISFVLDDHVRLKRIKLHDIVTEGLSGEDAHEVAISEFEIMSAELRSLIEFLDATFCFNS